MLEADMSAGDYEPLTLESDQTDLAVVVHVCGSVTINDADLFSAELQGLVERQVRTIVLDLREMDFICSDGLGAIISAHVKRHHQNEKLLLVAPQPSVRKMLETTRLTKLFPIYDTIEQALAEA